MQSELLIRRDLGKNDLPQINCTDLLNSIAGVLRRIHRLFLGSRVVWVNPLPRRVWRGMVNPKALQVGRCKINRKMRRIMQWCEGRTIS